MHSLMISSTNYCCGCTWKSTWLAFGWWKCLVSDHYYCLMYIFDSWVVPDLAQHYWMIFNCIWELLLLSDACMGSLSFGAIELHLDSAYMRSFSQNTCIQILSLSSCNWNIHAWDHSYIYLWDALWFQTNRAGDVYVGTIISFYINKYSCL